MSFTVTDVCARGAITVAFKDRSEALSHFALRRADGTVRYVQFVEDGVVMQMFVRQRSPYVTKLVVE